MTPNEALVQVAKDLHHLANALELLAIEPKAEYIPTEEENTTPVTEEETVTEEGANDNVEENTASEKEEKADEENHGIELETIRNILKEKSRSGLANEVNRLLLAFGVTKLPDVPYNKYPDLLLAAEEL